MAHDDPPTVAMRRDRTIQEYQHDSYKQRGKLKEPAACSRCGAVFHKGRWAWGSKPTEAHEITCPACHRIADHYPQGMLTLSGTFFAEHREEVLGLVHNEEAKEKTEHPLGRIMSIKQEAGKEHTGETVVATTDVHLPRRIGEALHHAYHGEFTFHYDKGEQFIRAKWHR